MKQVISHAKDLGSKITTLRKPIFGFQLSCNLFAYKKKDALGSPLSDDEIGPIYCAAGVHMLQPEAAYAGL